MTPVANKIPCYYCCKDEEKPLYELYDSKSFTAHILECHTDQVIVPDPADYIFGESYGLTSLFPEDEDDAEPVDLLLGSDGVVTAPATADVPAHLTVAVPGVDVVVAQPDARALALAMLEQVLPTMVRTYAHEDLTAVKSWVEEVLGIRDVELIMHDQFFLLSSVSLDLQVRMDLIDGVPVGSGDMAAVSGTVAVPGSNVALGLGTVPVPGSDLAPSRADVVEVDPSRADVVEPDPVRADVVESDPGRADVEADVDAEMGMILRHLQMAGGLM